jgi:hypothetical protein
MRAPRDVLTGSPPDGTLSGAALDTEEAILAVNIEQLEDSTTWEIPEDPTTVRRSGCPSHASVRRRGFFEQGSYSILRAGAATS